MVAVSNPVAAAISSIEALVASSSGRLACTRCAMSHRIGLVPLLPGERALIAEEEAGGVPVVATTFALHHVGQPAGTATWQRLPWEEMGRVHWERRTGVLTLVRFPGGPQRTVRLRLSPSSALPALVRERVAATEIAAAEIALTGYPSTVRARRRPGTTRIVWIVLLGAGVDPHDPQVQAGIDAATQELRTRLGL